MACLHNQIVVHKCYIPNLLYFCNSLGCFLKYKNVCWVAHVYATMTICLTQRHNICYFSHFKSALLQGAASLRITAILSFERHQNFNDVWRHRHCHQLLSMTICFLNLSDKKCPLLSDNSEAKSSYQCLVMPRRFVINDNLQRHFSSIFSFR